MTYSSHGMQALWPDMSQVEFKSDLPIFGSNGRWCNANAIWVAAAPFCLRGLLLEGKQFYSLPYIVFLIYVWKTILCTDEKKFILA